MTDFLSLWRSPLDETALVVAHGIVKRQPVCSILPDEDFSAMTIYNYEHYVAGAGGNPTQGLLNMLSAMIAGTGGSVGGASFIQQVDQVIDSSKGPFNVPNQCNMIASGGGGSGGTQFFHFEIQNSGGATFLKCSSAAQTTGGTNFQRLAFRWNNSTDVGDTCIYAEAQNCRAVRCTFTNCPVAFNAQGPSCCLEQCTIHYDRQNGATAVYISNSQCAALGPCEFSQQPINKGGPKCCTCFAIMGGADHTVIADIHISDWTTGIDFSRGGGAANTHIRNCEIQSWITALKVVVRDGAPIQGLKVTSTTLARTDYSADSQDPSPVVQLDPGTFGNSALSDITLLNCTVFNMGDASSQYMSGQHGLEIVGGTNIKIIGGTYSNNAPYPNQGAGIAITGACGDVQIIGANLQPKYEINTQNSTAQDQQFGLLVTANPAGVVLVSGCDMSGYTSPGSAVFISGVTSNLFIYDCLGYNDQNTNLTATTSQLTGGVSASSCNTPYYGPSIITFWNTSPVTLNIFGQTLTLSFGVVFLPSPYDAFYFSAVPNGFSWYGK